VPERAGELLCHDLWGSCGRAGTSELLGLATGGLAAGRGRRLPWAPGSVGGNALQRLPHLPGSVRDPRHMRVVRSECCSNGWCPDLQCLRSLAANESTLNIQSIPSVTSAMGSVRSSDDMWPLLRWYPPPREADTGAAPPMRCGTWGHLPCGWVRRTSMRRAAATRPS
jgi:hypothetical protein